jgi:hypothetical protein
MKDWVNKHMKAVEDRVALVAPMLREASVHATKARRAELAAKLGNVAELAESLLEEIRGTLGPPA